MLCKMWGGCGVKCGIKCGMTPKLCGTKCGMTPKLCGTKCGIKCMVKCMVKCMCGLNQRRGILLESNGIYLNTMFQIS
jgi:hypothetical protein